MTIGGWIIMLVSVLSVTGRFVWCIYMVLTTDENSDSLHGFEIETPDKE